jgi:hypothetical protein
MNAPTEPLRFHKTNNYVLENTCTAPPCMLAFDIETTGLDRDRCQVTVVCTEDFRTGEKRAYEFGRALQGGEEAQLHALKEQLVEAFDAAESLCAFNGVRFDLPFLYKALRLPEATVAGWMVKTTDILEACRLQVFGPRHTFGLNLLCQHNGVPMKSSSGCEAVRMAAQGRWQELLDYCADDVRILCDLYRRKVLRNPRGWQAIDLQRIAHDNLYALDGPGLAAPDIHVCQPEAPLPKEEARNAQQQVEALKAECAQLHLQLHDLRQQLQAQQLKLEVYKSICTCLDAFDTDL